MFSEMTPEFKKFIAGAIAAFLFFTFYFGFNGSNRYSSSAVPQALTVGTSADYPPISFLDSKGEIVGFDIDIIKEVACRLDRSVEIVDMPFEALIPQLQSGSLEIVVGGLTPTDKRRDVMEFSNPHYEAKSLVALSFHPNLDISSNLDLARYITIVNQGYFAVEVLKEVPGIKMLELPSIAEGVLALETGRGDVFVAEPQVLESIKSMAGKKIYMYPLDACDNKIAFGVSPKYSSFVEAINKVLDEMEQDGSLGEIRKKWGL